MRTCLAVAAMMAVVAVATGPARSAESALELAGVCVTPHVGTPRVRFRRPSLAPLDARVQLFVRKGADRSLRVRGVSFNGATAGQYLKQERWSWHDTPEVWTEAEKTIPAGALTVWSFNSVDPETPVLGSTLRVGVNGDDHSTGKPLDVALERPRLWLSAVTFLGQAEDVRPNQMIFYVRNETGKAYAIENCRLYLPRERETYRWLYPGPWLGDKVRPFSQGGIVEPSELSGARVSTGPLPLTYAAVEVRLRSRNGDVRSVWGYLRIKRESFDISGGWVSGSTPTGPSLAHEPFLKTLRRMHLNTAHISDTPGYTDQTGPDGLYTRYPLRYFNRLWPVERYDTDEMLPRIHAVEFLGEPQYRYGRNDKLPQQVRDAFLPYATSRLATTLTLSESHNWHLYAGVCDYAHYDAYRVTAPSPDSWSMYERWGGQQIRWGAPLETIGEMTRSLRETSRPAPVAYWSQGAHAGWDRYGGRARTSPTPDELRLQAYHALSSRITSLYWFNLSLKSVLKFRDLIEPITRVGREIRMLERFYLEGTACDYERIERDGAPDWDLASIAAPDAALLYALDLDYRADTEEKVFRFGPSRPARLGFDLPPYLRGPKAVFRIDAAGTYDVQYELSARGVRVDDRVGKVGVYIATKDPGLRGQLEARRAELIQYERSFAFDPAEDDADFVALQAIMRAPEN